MFPRMFQQFPPHNQMIDGKKHSDLFCVDAVSSTQGCPTPSITMSEDTPIREETDESFEEDDDSSDGYSDEVENIDASHDNHFHCIEHHPISHKRYMIRTRKEPRRILVLSDGALKLTTNPVSNSRAFAWICIRFGNWWSFRNLAANLYIGHNGAGKVVAMNPRFGKKNTSFQLGKRVAGISYIHITLREENCCRWQRMMMGSI